MTTNSSFSSEKRWDTTEIRRKMSDFCDLQCMEVQGRAQREVAQFHAKWLRFVVQHAPQEIPRVLSAIQARKSAALVLDELEAARQRSDAGVPSDLLAELDRFFAVRTELRRMALGLQVITGGGSSSDVGGLGDGGLRGFDLDRQGPSVSPEGQRRLLQEFEAKRQEYLKLRQALAAHPQLAVVAPELSIGVEQLQHGLSPSAALLLLVQVPRTADDDHADAADAIAGCHALVIRAAGEPQLVSLPWLERMPARMRRRVRDGTRAAGVRYSCLAVAEEPSPAARSVSSEPADASLTDEQLQEELQRHLWEPLQSHLNGLQQIHVVSHAQLHALPWELGARETLGDAVQLYSYPGLLFYWLGQQNALEPLPIAQAQIGLQVGDAGDRQGEGFAPIPFVQAEAAALRQLWAPDVHEPIPLQRAQPLAVVHAAGHGDAGQGADAFLLLDGGQRLGPSQVLGSALRAPLWFLAACLVGRTTEDLDGEPLGLVTALLLRGARHVIAPLVPIDDFYAPVLALLVHRQLRRQHDEGEALDAYAALEEAKQQLRTGRWHPPTLCGEAAERDEAQLLQLLQAAYAPLIEQMLSAACAARSAPWGEDDRHGRMNTLQPLNAQLRAWAGRAGDGELTMLRQAMARQADTAAAATVLIGQLFGTAEARARLAAHPAVRGLLRFVQAFGAPAVKEKTAAVEH
jgi:hypothetical protein